MIIGIDPGITGAVGIISNNNKYIDSFSMPSRPSPRFTTKNRREIDAKALLVKLELYIGNISDVIVVIESVFSRPTDGPVQSFAFGDTFGSIRSIIDCMGLELAYVKPQAWKKALGVTKDKSYCLKVAQSLYPSANLVKKKDVDRAEALLIAYYHSLLKT